MALPTYFSTTATLAGAIRIIRMFRPWAEQDGAGKLQALISQVNALTSNVVLLQSAAVSANVSGGSFSALSGVTFSVYATISNFTTT